MRTRWRPSRQAASTAGPSSRGQTLRAVRTQRRVSVRATQRSGNSSGRQLFRYSRRLLVTVQSDRLEKQMTLQNRRVAMVVAMLAVTVLPLSAQSPAQPRPPQTFPAYLQGQYATLKRNIT